MNAAQISSILILGILGVLLVISNIIFFIYFIHKQDPNQSLIPKAICLSSLLVFSITQLVLVLDAINTSPFSLKFSTTYIWIFFTILVFSYSLIFVPFGIVYYNSFELDLKTIKQKFNFSFLNPSFIITSVLIALFISAFTFSYFKINSEEEIASAQIYDLKKIYELNSKEKNKIEIKMGKEEQEKETKNFLTEILNNSNNNEDYVKKGYQKTIYPRKLFLFSLHFMTFLASFIFYILLPIGLICLPFDLLSFYTKRPKLVRYDEFKSLIGTLKKDAEKVENFGNSVMLKLKKKNNFGTGNNLIKRIFPFGNSAKKGFGRFSVAYSKLLEKFRLLNISYKLKGGNPILYGGSLLLSIFCFLFSITIILQIIFSIFLYNLAVQRNTDITLLKSTDLFLTSFEAANTESNNTTKKWFSYFNTEFNFGLIDNLLSYMKRSGFSSYFIISVLIFCLVAFYIQVALLNGLSNLCYFVPEFISPVPLKTHETYANDFLVNCLILMLCIFPAIQFLVINFVNFAGISPATEIFFVSPGDDSIYVKLWKANIFMYVFMGVGLVVFVGKIVGMFRRTEKDFRNIEIYID